MKLQFDQKNSCEVTGKILALDFTERFLANGKNIDQDIVDDKIGNHPDYKLSFGNETISFEIKSGIWKKNGKDYTGSIRFTKNQIVTSNDKLYVLLAKGDNGVDIVKICWFDIEELVKKHYFNPTKDQYRYRFGKDKNEYFRNNLLHNKISNESYKITCLATYKAHAIKRIVNNYNQKVSETHALTVKDTIQKMKIR